MWGNSNDKLGVFLPHPDDKSDAPRTPHTLHVGTYRFLRESYGTLVSIEEPIGDTYELEWFEWVRYLNAVLKLDEMDGNLVGDRLWNWNAIEVDILPGLGHVPIRTFDPTFEKMIGEA